MWSKISEKCETLDHVETKKISKCPLPSSVQASYLPAREGAGLCCPYNGTVEAPASGRHPWSEREVPENFAQRVSSSCTWKPLPLSLCQIILHSMHRYKPRFHIVQADDLFSVRWSIFQVFSFPETVFTSVTAYQNEQVMCESKALLNTLSLEILHRKVSPPEQTTLGVCDG